MNRTTINSGELSLPIENNYTKMKTLAILFSFLYCISLNAQKGNLFLSNWHGSGSEDTVIPSEKYSFSRKARLYYFISNDNTDLYLYLKTGDPGDQARILKQGLTVWINMDGKLTKKMGIHFPIGSQNSGSQKKSGNPGMNLNDEGNVITLVSFANKIELIGFTNEEVRRFPSENRDNFTGSVKIDNDGSLHYRMKMPIAKLPVRNSKDGRGAMPFILGIEYGQITGQKTSPPVLLWIKNIKLATDK